MAWIAPAIEVGGSLIGQMMASGKQGEIAALRAEAMERYGNTNLSTLEALAKEKLGPSKLGGVSMDSKYKSAQDAALDKLMGIANSNGLDAQSLAKMEQAKQAAFGVQRGMQGAAEQSLARRGMLSSGAAVSSRLGAAQAGVNRAYAGNVAAAGDASERALQALMAGGSMARGLGQDDLGQKNLAAGADDRIAQFNLGHRTNAEQAVFNAKMGRAAGMNSVGNQQAQDLQDQADRDARMVRGTAKAAGTAWDYGRKSDNSIDPVTGKRKYNDGYDEQGDDWNNGG